MGRRVEKCIGVWRCVGGVCEKRCVVVQKGGVDVGKCVGVWGK